MKKLLIGTVFSIMALFTFNGCTDTKDSQETKEPSSMKCEAGKCGGDMKKEEMNEQSGNTIPSK